jgi:hypothetical protein
MLKPQASAPSRAIPAQPQEALRSQTIETEATVVDGAEHTVEGQRDTNQQAGKKPSRVRKPISYSFVKDINWHPNTKQSLREFFAAKRPTTQQEEATIILYYLTKMLELKNVGSNHLYTGWKEVERPVPADIVHVARLTAHRKNWIDSSKSDDLKLTVSGENFVEHDLPAKGSQKAE